MQLSPGYFSFVKGECDRNTGETKLAAAISPGFTVKDFFDIAMYSGIEHKAFVVTGLNRFIKTISILKLGNIGRIELDKLDKMIPRDLIKYYYNRQLIIQMTSIPLEIPVSKTASNPHHVSVPLYRQPNYEVQVDMLALQFDQRRTNYNIKFLVVIVDPFSNYIWSYPVATTESIKVLNAFFRALSRPGDPEKFYLRLRNQVQRIVVDGGSEFKKHFNQHIKKAFPNARIIVSTAKSKTGGRPTGNGPIEAAINTLRRVIRDYSLSVNADFLKKDGDNNETQFGLGKILNAYNNTIQTGSREDMSPQSILESSTSGIGNTSTDLHAKLNEKRTKKIELQKIQREGFSKNDWELRIHKRAGIGYRKYITPGAFAKRVDLRVSLDLYAISKLNVDGTVDLVDYTTLAHKESKVPISNLVTVKTPVYDGPPILRQNLQKEVDVWGFKRATPKEVSDAFPITNAIKNAVGVGDNAHIVNEPVDNNPTRVSQRVRRAPERY